MRESRPRIPEFLDGEVINRFDLPGLVLGEIIYSPGYQRPLHRHERACLHFLFQSGYIEFEGTRSRECGPFTLSFQPPGHEHSYRCLNAVSRSFTIELESGWLSELSEHSVKLERSGNFRSALIQWLITRLYREFSVREEDSLLVMEGLMLEIAVEISRRQLGSPDRKPPAWLKQVDEFLHQHFTESLSLPHIARIVGVHPVHLARTFRFHHGCTVGEYLRQLKIEFACRQISGSNDRLVDIALSSGFCDQSRFSHTFKRVMGINPTDYRAATRFS